ncbi:hypothetical protein [Aquimarina agarilytica]|uniref:hypothetical protein n=1 Tax=Aquimarina agarilytica TaxID=1087449 RepID=UPI0002883E08|nr:hypothetical protein [Aquimarina agarilytica]
MSDSVLASYENNSGSDALYTGLLATLKPSATQLLIHCNDTQITDCIKLTLLDLCLKQVIHIKKSSLVSPNKKESIIETGAQFNTYQADSFEYYFTRILSHNITYPLPNYIKKIHSDLPDDYSCYQKIITSAQTTAYFNKGWFCRFFQLTKLNPKGKKVAEHLNQSLAHIDNNLVQLINQKPAEATTLIKNLGGNVFLLTALNFEIFEHLKTALSAIERIHQELPKILDVLYLSENTYIISDMYDYFSKLREQLR